jgi:glycosyltransferase involved in cell wall biosynthesis
MRVLHVITGLLAGGAEQQLRLLVRHTRHHADVATLYNRGLVADGIEADGSRVVDLRMRGNRDLSALGRLVRLMRAGRYEVVHVHLYRACVYGRIAARIAGVPVVVTTEHSLGEHQIEGRPKTWGVRALYLATDRLSDVTIAVSGAVRERLVEWGVSRGKIEVIPVGLDFGALAFDAAARRSVRSSLGIPDDAYVIGGLGRLEPGKRFHALVSAVAPLLGPGHRLVLVGDGRERQRLAQLAHAAGAAYRVIFTGERADVGALLSAIDLLVSPSEDETFGAAVLEALAAGLPVLYVRCPALDGVRISAAHQVGGTVEQLRAALVEQGRAGRQPGGRAGTALDRYDITTCSRAVDELYERVALGTSRRGLSGTARAGRL